MKRSLLACAALLLFAVQPAAAQDEEQRALTRGLLEAVRANTDALRKNQAALETLANRLERVETAVRNVPPSVEGLRTDVIAIRATLDRMVSGPAGKRSAATVRFGPFVCGNQNEQACAASACRSVGFGNGVAVAVNRTGSAAANPASLQEATCFD